MYDSVWLFFCSAVINSHCWKSHCYCHSPCPALLEHPQIIQSSSARRPDCGFGAGVVAFLGTTARFWSACSSQEWDGRTEFIYRFRYSKLNLWLTFLYNSPMYFYLYNLSMSQWCMLSHEITLNTKTINRKQSQGLVGSIVRLWLFIKLFGSLKHFLSFLRFADDDIDVISCWCNLGAGSTSTTYELGNSNLLANGCAQS